MGGVTAAYDSIAEGVDGPDLLDAKLAAAGFEFSDFDEVEDQIVEVFSFLGGAGGEFHLERAEFAGVVLGEGVERETQAADGIAEFLRGDGEKAGFEAIHFGDFRHVFKEGDGAEKLALAVAHGGGAEAVAAFCLTDAHGKEGGFTFAGAGGALHGDRGADGAEDSVAAGGAGEDHAVDFSALGGSAEEAEKFHGGLVELENLALAVGDDDGLEDGTDDGVDELEFHLTAAGFGFAEVAEADGETVEFGGDGAEIVFGTPLDALVEVALADAASHTRGMTQRRDDQEEHDRGDDGGGGDGETAGGDEAVAELILPDAQGGDGGIAVCGELIEVAAELDVQGFEGTGKVGRILGRVLGEPRVLLGEAIDGERGVEAADVVNGSAEKELTAAGLVAELGEGGVSGGDAGGDELLMGDGALG